MADDVKGERGTQSEGLVRKGRPAPFFFQAGNGLGTLQVGLWCGQAARKSQGKRNHGTTTRSSPT